MRHKSLINKLTAAFMTVCLTIGSAGTLPVTVYGEGEGTDTTDIISTDSPDFDIDEKVTTKKGAPLSSMTRRVLSPMRSLSVPEISSPVPSRSRKSVRKAM